MFNEENLEAFPQKSRTTQCPLPPLLFNTVLKELVSPGSLKKKKKVYINWLDVKTTVFTNDVIVHLENQNKLKNVIREFKSNWHIKDNSFN